VASGALEPGAPVPSVRDLASELRINPATVAKGYQRLAEAGILTVRRGDGTYVADAPPAMGKAERGRILAEPATAYAGPGAPLGLSEGEAADALRAAWKKGMSS